MNACIFSHEYVLEFVFTVRFESSIMDLCNKPKRKNKPFMDTLLLYTGSLKVTTSNAAALVTSLKLLDIW